MSEESPASSTTLLPPATGLLRPGTTFQAVDRSILEMSAVLGPLTTLRGRFAVLENTLAVADSEERAGLALEANVPSLHTTRPLAGRRLLGRNGLDARRNRLLRLEMEGINTAAVGHRRVRAKLQVRGASMDFTMNLRIAVRAEDRIALMATGTISSRAFRENCSVRLPRSVPADRIRFMLAADFR